jgi:DNA polymerase-1
MMMDLRPSDEEFNLFVKEASEVSFIAVDTETTGKEYDIRDGSGHALGLSIAYRRGTEVISGYFPFRHYNGENYSDERLAKVKDLIENSGAIIFHNSKFDLVSLRTLGISVPGLFYDTMLMAHMLDENLLSKQLDVLAKTMLNDPGKVRSPEMRTFLEFAGWKQIYPELIAEYAAHDADITLRLFEHLFLKFGEEGFVPDLWQVEQDFIRGLVAMERRGILIDLDLCQEQTATGEKRMQEIKSELKMNPGSRVDLQKLLINELDLPVLQRTANGSVSFNKDAMEEYDRLLEKYEDGDPRAALVLEYRGWQKTVSSNYKAYITLLSPDGRVRPNYKIHGTKTGRLSCEKPNLQQIPRTSDKPWNGRLKHAFVPKPGYRLIEADYSQLEFRLGSAYSKDENLIAIFNSGEDIFTAMAHEIGMARQSVKTLTYTIMFGGGLTRISNVFDVDMEQAAILRGRYYDTYPGLKKASAIAATKAKSQGYIKMWTGRRRHFKYPESESHKAFNALCQGGGAEIVKRALITCDKNLQGDSNCRMLLQIHDALVFEIREDLVDDYSPQIQAWMEKPEGTPDFGVNFDVKVEEWGSH